MLLSTEKKRLLRYLEDDHARQDATSNLTPRCTASAIIRVNENCVLAGLEEAAFLFESQGLKTRKVKVEGIKVRKGPILKIVGLNRDILRVERTALNVLGRMSGVATLCFEAKKLAGDKTSIGLTRKTIPGFNLFDKKAAKIAGIFPHRINLEEMVLIKENHLQFFKSVTDAINTGKKSRKSVEIEVENESQAVEAAHCGPDVLMLDNFSLSKAKKTIPILRKISPKTRIELSGGIGPLLVQGYSNLKPDIISLGYLTKSAKTIDFSLDLQPI